MTSLLAPTRSASHQMLFNPAAVLAFGAIAPFVLWLGVRYWQNAILAVFVLMVFEGALRKWVFPGAQAEIYFLKDAVLLAAYLGFLLDGRKGQIRLQGVTWIRILLVLYVIFAIIEIFNPNSPSILVWLIGFKSYFLYAPIAFILPYIIESRQHLLDLVRRYLIMACPVAALGFIQVVAGPGSSINTYVSYSEDAAILTHFGRGYDLVRTSGTFSYISGYATFLSFVGFLAIGYNLAQRWRIKNNLIPLLALALVVGAMFTTGSRAPVFTIIAAVPFILWLATIGRILALQTAVRLCIMVPIIAFVALNVSPRAFEAFTERVTDSEDSTLDRILSPVFETSLALSGAPILGIGLGTTHPSALTIMGVNSPWWLQDLLTEVEMARITVELGVIGLLLAFALRILIAALALLWAMSFKDPVYKAFGIVLAIYLVFGVMGSIMLNPTSGIYYWGALGLVLAMRRLEQTARDEARIRIKSSRTTPAAIYAEQT